MTAGEDQVGAVRRWFSAARRVTVLTGAGISTASGIPDYRGPNGVWTRDPSKMRLVDISAYLADPHVRREAWQERLHHPAWTAIPNEGHRALVELERQGKLRALITQNIDGLHQAAGSSPEMVLELHGSIHRCRCLECGHETSMRAQLERVESGEPDPSCPRCGGIQRSATIAFGQSLDPDVLRQAMEASATCDLFLGERARTEEVAGASDQLARYLRSASRATSLTVRPSALAFFLARSKSAGATR